MDEEMEMTERTCIGCGNDFEISDEEIDNTEYSEYCEDCREVLENADNPDLVIAFAEYFGEAVSDVTEESSDRYSVGRNTYLVLDEDDADEKVKDYIEDSLWAFNPSFLANETGLPEELFEALAENGRCEGNNDAVYQCINRTCGIDDFVDSAISEDGRGHFISNYDGEEHEIRVGNDLYFAYRES